MANLPTTYAGLAEADRAEALAAAVSASPGRSTSARKAPRPRRGAQRFVGGARRRAGGGGAAGRAVRHIGRGPTRDAARRGGVRPRVLPRPKPPAGRRGLRAHVARGGPGDAAAARRRRAGGAGAGAPDSSHGLVITWVSSESQMSRRWRTHAKEITTSPAPARRARAPWRASAP